MGPTSKLSLQLSLTLEILPFEGHPFVLNIVLPSKISFETQGRSKASKDSAHLNLFLSVCFEYLWTFSQKKKCTHVQKLKNFISSDGSRNTAP